MSRPCITWPDIEYCCLAHGECVCGPEERVLRAHKAGKVPSPMTAEQREWCLQEIGQIEGHDRAEHEADNDVELAECTISAWTDYCQDKGLLP